MDCNALKTLEPGEHACCFFRRNSQVVSTITSVARALPGRPEFHFFFAAGELEEHLLSLLSTAFRAERDLAGQNLVICPGPLTKDGRPPGEQIIGQLDERLAEHAPGARVHLSVMMTGPALAYPAAEWFWHLGAFNSYLRQKNCSCLSLYREAAFAPLFVFQCLRVHPVAIAEGAVLTNPFYIPAVSLAAALGRPDPRQAAGNGDLRETADRPGPDPPRGTPGRAPDPLPVDAGAYDDLAAMTPNPVFLTDEGGRISFANAAAAALLQRPASSLTGLPYAKVVDPADQAGAGRWLDQVLAGRNAAPLEVRVPSGGGTARVRCYAAALARGGQIVWEDLSLRDRLEVSTILNERLSETCDRLKEQTVRDALTGLYNRQYFEEEVRRFRNPRQWPVSALLIDVDGLKKINDTRGHARGDLVLRLAASAIKAPFREGDVIARIGGDEFAVVLPRTDYACACTRKEEILKEVAAVNARGETGLRLSIGVATSEGPEPSVEELINLADMDMYRVKGRTGRQAPREG